MAVESEEDRGAVLLKDRTLVGVVEASKRDDLRSPAKQADMETVGLPDEGRTAEDCAGALGNITGQRQPGGGQALGHGILHGHRVFAGMDVLEYVRVGSAPEPACLEVGNTDFDEFLLEPGKPSNGRKRFAELMKSQETDLVWNLIDQPVARVVLWPRQ